MGDSPRCVLLVICAGIASTTFVADVPFALSISLIFIAALLFFLLLAELLTAANILRRSCIE